MTPILRIAGDSLRGLAMHNRPLVALVFAWPLLSSLGAVLLTPADPGTGETGPPPMVDVETIILAAFSTFTTFVGNLLALLIGSTIVAADIRRGTIQQILSGPVTRLRLLLGRFCAAAAAMLAWSLAAGIAFAITALGRGEGLAQAALLAPWLMFCENLMLGSAALLLSLLMHPALAGVAAFLASARLFSHPNPLYYILPSYDRFAFDLLQSQPVPLEDLVILTLYALDVAVIFLLLALWRFRSRVEP